MIRKLTALILSSCIILTSLTAAAQEKQIIGWLEKTRIYPGNLSLVGRIDTGAKTSSINAPRISYFKKDNKKWVRFDITNKKGKRVQIERMVVRSVEIKRKGMFSQKRPVIMLGICIGSVYKEVEVNLVDRSHYNYQVLIGRNFLQNSFIVDPSLTFTAKSRCREVVPK